MGTTLSATSVRARRAVVALAGVTALAFAATAPSVASGVPTDTDTDVDATDDVDAAVNGVYEACSPNFGLGKVVEIVVEVDGVVPTPPLTFPEDVDIVTSWETAAGLQTCIPEPVTPELWATESLWSTALDVPAPVGNYVFLPYDSEADACDATHMLTLVGAPEGYTIAVGEAVVPPVEHSLFCPGGDDDAEAVFLAAAADVVTAPQLAALDAYFGDTNPVEGCDKTDGSGTPSTDLAGAADALIAALDPAFLTLYEDESVGDTPCEAVDDVADTFYFQTLYHLEVDRQAVFELTTPPAPAVIEPTFTG